MVEQPKHLTVAERDDRHATTPTSLAGKHVRFDGSNRRRIDHHGTTVVSQEAQHGYARATPVTLMFKTRIAAVLA